MKKIRVVSVGLGPIGLAAARLVLSKNSIELVGAVDPDPDKAGRDLGDLLGGPSLGISVCGKLSELYEKKPDAVLHCTSSFLPQVEQQILEAVDAGINVVSSTEELLAPWFRHPNIAEELDRRALAGNATILGTGVNPGYAMDFLAVVASAVCFDLSAVRCTRVVDAGTRRLPLQQKVGAGLSPDEFRTRQEAGGFGHIGMEESVALVGRALGLSLDRVEQSLEPVIADQEHKTPFLTVASGRVAGIRNLGRGWRRGELVVELDLTMAVGSKEPRDVIEIVGDPPIKLRVDGGIPGDQATAAILVNSLMGVVQAAPGLKTVLDLPSPRLVR